MTYKSSKRILLLTIMAMILFIASASLFSFLSVNSRYYLSDSRELSIEAISSKPFSYYMYDGNGSSRGVYSDTVNISQNILIRSTPTDTIYQIKIPVTSTGYYNVNFDVDFTKQGGAQKDLIMSDRMYNPIGCQIMHQATHKFGSSSSKLVLLEKSEQEFIGNMVTHDMANLITAVDHYQWKTLAPSLSEAVSLTFRATQADVDVGYVIWAWNFGGLVGRETYTINLRNFNVEKTIELAPTSDKPYFNFAEMQYVNNTVNPEASTTAGFTRHTGGKATYVTEATSNSMTMQIAPLFAGWNSSGLTAANGSQYENLTGFNIPLKNVEYDKTYKVAFDVKIARQGSAEVDSSTTQQEDVLYCSDYDSFFFNLNQTNSTDRTLMFESYLHSGTVGGRTKNDHNTAKQQITMNNVLYTPSELTRYDELRYNTSSSNSLNEISYNSATSINSLYTTNGERANLMNAVRYTEVNIQNTIYWIGFFNTTFTFNISSSNTDVDLDDLYWVWAIEPLYAGRWFRFKFENVRIEEVVQYGSNIDVNGIKINNTQVTNFNNYTTTEDNFLRGSNGTGQNYQALGYKTTKKMAAYNTFAPIYDAKYIYFSSNSETDYHIYLNGYCVADGGVEKYVWSPDLGETWYDMVFVPGRAVNKIQLEDAERKIDQTQVVNVMQSGNTTGEKSVGSMHDSSLINESINSLGFHDQVKDNEYDFIDFEIPDAVNSAFKDFTMYADISEYKNCWEMDIIFAAVPKTNSNARCEILRMTNVNTRHKYRSYIDAIESDINVLTNVDTYTGASGSGIQSARLNAIAGGTTAGNTNWQTTARYTEGFNLFLGIAGNGVGTASGGGYASKINKNTISETVPLFSGFPIQESITIKGWAVCIDSISSYYYSTDDGKTWAEITGTRANGNPAAGLNDQALWWMDRSITTADTGNSLFTENSTALKINLSKYKGQSIDLLVAAKPVGRDSYCPIVRIDKVLVYGHYLYYSRLDSITIDDSLSINNDVSGETDEINIYPYNDLRLSTNLIRNEAHTIYEPYGIDVLSSRKTVAQTVSISNGGKISLNGFCFAYGGVKEYRYTIDGGKTWTTINKDITYNSPDNAIMKIIKLTSTSMTADSGKNGNFSSGHGSSRTLDFNIPNTFNSGDTFNLILAGISKYGDNVPFPVLNMTLKIK